MTGFKGARKKKYRTNSRDAYGTPRWATEEIIRAIDHSGEIRDPCCGAGSICNTLSRYPERFTVSGSDLRTEGIWPKGKPGIDYLEDDTINDVILTNPPYHLTLMFFLHAWQHTRKRITFLVPMGWLNSMDRNPVFHDYPPEIIAIHSRRPQMWEEGMFPYKLKGGGVIDFCWVSWNILKPTKYGNTRTIWLGSEIYNKIGSHTPDIPNPRWRLK